MLDDYVIAASAGVIVASAVVMATLLTRYARMVKEADNSTRLAKDVWDSVNSRFSVLDTRIIDLMARTEVLSSRLNPTETVSTQIRPPLAHAGGVQTTITKPSEPAKVVAQAVLRAEGTETEEKVLRLLSQGPRTSSQIKEELGRSREHTARLMKTLFNRGLVVRNDRNKPYVYEITDSGRSYVAS